MASPKKAPLIDWEKLDQLIENNESPGPEWFCVHDFVVKYKCTKAAACGRITRLLELGKLEITKSSTKNRKSYYRLKS